MKRTPNDTPVGIDDPLALVDRCDWVTQDGRCRLAIEHPERDADFAMRRQLDDYECPYLPDAWTDCEHFAASLPDKSCIRCGLPERRLHHNSDASPLLHEHHVSYADGDGNDITVMVCRWCHAKIHRQGVRLDDDVDPSPEAVDELERRRRIEREQGGFVPANERERE